MAISRGGMGKEVAGARLKKRAMGASRQGKKMVAAEMMMPSMASMASMDMKKGRKMAASEMMPPMAPMAMKHGGMAKKTRGSTEDIMGTGKTKALAKADYEKKMKAVGLKPKPEKKMMGGGMAMKPGGMGYKKGGIALMIVLGKGDGKKKSK